MKGTGSEEVQVGIGVTKLTDAGVKNLENLMILKAEDLDRIFASNTVDGADQCILLRY